MSMLDTIHHTGQEWLAKSNLTISAVQNRPLELPRSSR
jgi:hypothetical protein